MSKKTSISVVEGIIRPETGQLRTTWKAFKNRMMEGSTFCRWKKRRKKNSAIFSHTTYDGNVGVWLDESGIVYEIRGSSQDMLFGAFMGRLLRCVDDGSLPALRIDLTVEK